MTRDLMLLYLSSDYIVDYVRRHPIKWEHRELTNRRGCLADQANKPPTPSCAEFLALLAQRRTLFTQDEFADHCLERWQVVDPEWTGRLSERVRFAVWAKQRYNFYPSMIDSLHAWALLCETGIPDTCILDSYDDAVAKTDLTVCRAGKSVRVALLGPTQRCREARRHKVAHRGGEPAGTIEIQMPKDRERKPGNKKWWVPQDFDPVFDAFVEQRPATQAALL